MNISKQTLFIGMLFISALPFSSMAINSTATSPKAQTEMNVDKQSVILMNRIYEIQAMDKSKLSRREKSNLKSELKKMKTQIHGARSGIYISTGAVILIILLIILL